MNTHWLDIENRHVAFMNEETCFLNEHMHMHAVLNTHALAIITTCIQAKKFYIYAWLYIATAYMCIMYTVMA